MSVSSRVVESHEPLDVKIGVRRWKAKRVPVGRRFAKCAVLDKVWVTARCEREGEGEVGGGGGASFFSIRSCCSSCSSCSSCCWGCWIVVDGPFVLLLLVLRDIV